MQDEEIDRFVAVEHRVDESDSGEDSQQAGAWGEERIDLSQRTVVAAERSPQDERQEQGPQEGASLLVLQFADCHESSWRPGSIFHLDKVQAGIEGCDVEAFALCSAGS